MRPRERDKTWDLVVGGNLRRFRMERGLSQETLAAEAGISMRHVGRVERAESSATVELLAALSKVLNVEPTSFFAVVGAATPRG